MNSDGEFVLKRRQSQLRFSQNSYLLSKIGLLITAKNAKPCKMKLESSEVCRVNLFWRHT